MNKIRIIDLLNKIANGEEVPEKIIYREKVYFWCTPCNDYDYTQDASVHLKDCIFNLNDEVEVIEEDKKTKNITWEQKESMAGFLNKEQEIEVLAKRTEKLKKTLNEIIDKINKMEEKK